MLKVLQSVLIVILTQLLSIYIFAIFVVVFNLNLFNQLSNLWISFGIHNILILFVYALITVLINKYFKVSSKLNNKSKILGSLLLISYLFVFYLSNQNLNLFRIFLLIHYPIGSFFRTIPYSYFDLLLQISIILSIVSSMLGLYIGQGISILVHKKKKKLSSLSKKQ